MTATETAGTIRRMIFEGGAINWFIIALYFFMLLVAAERAVFYGATSYNRKKVMAAVRALQTEKELKDFLSQPWPGRYLNSVPFCIIREFCDRFENDAVVLNEALDLRFSLLQRQGLSIYVRCRHLSIRPESVLCRQAESIIEIIAGFWRYRRFFV